MTNKEAIKKIEDVLYSDCRFDETLDYQLTSDDFEWLEKAKEALDKQIPRKPCKVDKIGTRYTSSYRCPVCGGNFTGTGIADYCYHCGQRLDWNEGELFI